MDSRTVYKESGSIKNWFRSWFRRQSASGKAQLPFPKDVVWPLNQDLPPEVEIRKKKLPHIKTSEVDSNRNHQTICRRSASYDQIRDCLGVPEIKIRPKSACRGEDPAQLRPRVKDVKRSYLVDQSLANQLIRTSTKAVLEKKPTTNLSKLNLSPIKESEQKMSQPINPYHVGPDGRAISVAASHVPNAKEAYKMLKKLREGNSILGDDEMSFVTTYSRLQNEPKRMVQAREPESSMPLRNNVPVTARAQMRKAALSEPPNVVLRVPKKKVTIQTPSHKVKGRSSQRPPLGILQNIDSNIPSEKAIHDESKPPKLPPTIMKKTKTEVVDVGCKPEVKNARETAGNDCAKKENLRFGVGYSEGRMTKSILWYDAEDLDSSILVDGLNCEHRINLSKLVERSVQLNLERILSKNGLPLHRSPKSGSASLSRSGKVERRRIDTSSQGPIYQNIPETRAHSRCSQGAAPSRTDDGADDPKEGGPEKRKRNLRRVSSLPCLSDFVASRLTAPPLGEGLIRTGVKRVDGAAGEEKVNNNEREDIDITLPLDRTNNLQDTLPAGLLSATDFSLLIGTRRGDISRISLKSPVKRIICKPKGKEVFFGKSKIKLVIAMNQNLLRVNVIRAVHLLPSKSLLANAYAKVSLAPDKDLQFNWRSKITRSTNNPFFGYEISIPFQAEMVRRRLVISLWNRESNTKRSEFLGCATFKMENFLQNGCGVRGWYRILSFSHSHKQSSFSFATFKELNQQTSRPVSIKEVTDGKVVNDKVEPDMSDSWII